MNIHFDPSTHCSPEIHPITGPCVAQWMMTPGVGNTSWVLLALLLVTSVPVLPGDSSSCDTAECGEDEGARSENIWTQHQHQHQEQEQEEAVPGDMARVALVLGASGETGKVISTSLYYLALVSTC